MPTDTDGLRRAMERTSREIGKLLGSRIPRRSGVGFALVLFDDGGDWRTYIGSRDRGAAVDALRAMADQLESERP